MVTTKTPRGNECNTMESNDAKPSLQGWSKVMYNLGSNDARAQSAKPDPSHIHPAKQTKPAPGLSLQGLSQVRFWKAMTLGL